MNLLWLLWWTQLFNAALSFFSPFSSSGFSFYLSLSAIRRFFLFPNTPLHSSLLICVESYYITKIMRPIPGNDRNWERQTRLKKKKWREGKPPEREESRRGWWGRRGMERGCETDRKKERLNRWIWFIYNEISLTLHRGMCSVWPFCCNRHIYPFNILKISASRYMSNI